MSAQNPTPTTELDAVNQMLRAIGETPVSSLFSSEGIDVPSARATLAEINLAVQSEGWDFNTEENFPLTRSVTGTITAPMSALNVDFDWRNCHGTKPVQRGTKVYDKENHTYIFSVNLKAEIIFALPFEDLPQTARSYITYRACRKFQDTEVGSNELHRYTQADEMRARAQFVSRHTVDQDLNMLRDTPDFAHLR